MQEIQGASPVNWMGFPWELVVLPASGQGVSALLQLKRAAHNRTFQRHEGPITPRVVSLHLPAQHLGGPIDLDDSAEIVEGKEPIACRVDPHNEKD